MKKINFTPILFILLFNLYIITCFMLGMMLGNKGINKMDKERFNRDMQIVREFPSDERYSPQNVARRYRKQLAENLESLIEDSEGKLNKDSTLEQVIDYLKG